jgi:hypothetical protein
MKEASKMIGKQKSIKISKHENSSIFMGSEKLHSPFYLGSMP